MKTASFASLLITVVVASVAVALPARAEKPGEEVEVTSGQVTALSCALQAQTTGDLKALSYCPLSEAQKGLVVFDVTERAVYRLSEKTVFLYELESAFGGGSIDLIGTVTSVDKKTGVAVVDISEYSITKKPKAGAFKGCL